MHGKMATVMGLDRGRLKPKNILAIVAEICTIFSLISAWIFFFKEQEPPTESTSYVDPLLLFFVIVNSVMLVFLSTTIARGIVTYINGKKRRLLRKVNTYIDSDPIYLHQRRQCNCNEYEALIKRTKNASKKLDENKAFDEDVYYMLLYSLFFDAEETINVVSVLDDNEWVDTPEEDEFLRVNLKLSDKKVHLNRIFVVEENEIASKLCNKSIQSFIEADHSYIHLFVCLKNKLSRSVVNNIGSGFIEFYGFMVACDIFADNEIRGTIKADSAEVELYHKIYMQLTEYYQPLNQEFVQQHFSQKP